MSDLLTPSNFLGGDTTKPAVRQVFGLSGSGKTVWLRELLLKANNFDPLMRVVVFDIKHSGYSDTGEVVDDWPGFVKSLRKNRVTVVHPEIEVAQSFLHDIITHLFDMTQSVEGFGASLILEESSTYIRPTVMGVPPAIKRMATQGREFGLTLILVNQRALNSRWTDSQSQSIVLFRLPTPDHRLLFDRWGLRFDEVDERLRETKFSFAVFDLESLQLDYYQPVEITPTPSSE